jgi:WD40 repeat protein
MSNNLILNRRIQIVNDIIITTSFPKDIAKLISEYDYYLQGISSALTGHSESVECVAVLPSSSSDCSPWQTGRAERIISGSGDKTIKIWNPIGSLRPLRQLRQLRQPQINISNISDTKCSSQEISYECGITLTGHTDKIWCVAALSDKRIVSGSMDSTIKLWNVETGKCEITFKGHVGSVYCVTIVPGDPSNCCFAERYERIVSGSYDRTLKIWNPNLLNYNISDSKSSEIICHECDNTLMGHTDRVWCVATLPDRRIVSGSGDTTLKIWNLQTGSCDITLSGHISAIYCITVIMPKLYSTTVFADSPYYIVSGSCDTTLKIWNPFHPHRQAQIDNCDATFVGHTSYVYCISSLPDERIVSTSGDKTLKIWNLQTGECDNTFVQPNNLTKRMTNTIYCVTVLSDGRIVSGSYDCTLKIWS